MTGSNGVILASHPATGRIVAFNVDDTDLDESIDARHSAEKPAPPRT